MYFITTKRMLEVCFSAHPNIQYRTLFLRRNGFTLALHKNYRNFVEFTSAVVF